MTVTPDDVAANYDLLAEHWAGDTFPRDNGIAQHERAVAFVERRGQALRESRRGHGTTHVLRDPRHPETLGIIDDAGCICRHLEYDQHSEPHVYVIAQRD